MPKKIIAFNMDRIDLCENPANQESFVMLFKSEDYKEAAVWTTAYVNSLPDSCFAYVSGNTRHLPYKDKSGKVDAAHVRNALARLNQTGISSAAKASAHAKLVRAARSVGVEVGKCQEVLTEPVFKELADVLEMSFEDASNFDANFEKIVDILEKLNNNENISSVGKAVEELKKLGGDEMSDKVKELEAQLAKAEEDLKAKDAEIATLKTQAEELKKAIPPKEEDIWKNVNPALKAQFENMQKSLNEATEKQEVADITKSVTTDLSKIPGKVEDNVGLLRQIKSKVEKAAYDKLVEVLKSASVLIEKSELLEEKGGAGKELAGSAAQKFMTAVNEALAKKDAPNLADAMKLVAKRDPALYNDYTNEVRKGSKN